jgi:uncharacterized membrane protein YphA (DoxX/SURF4 family)
MKKKTAVEIISLLFIFLFTYAAFSKFHDFGKFSTQLGQSPLLTNIAAPVSWFIPAFELVIAAALAIPKYRLLALYVSFTLMSLFTFYIIAITRFSDYVPCSCGGILQQMTWDQHLIFNIGFVLLAATAVLLNRVEEPGPAISTNT